PGKTRTESARALRGTDVPNHPRDREALQRTPVPCHRCVFRGCAHRSSSFASSPPSAPSSRCRGATHPAGERDAPVAHPPPRPNGLAQTAGLSSKQTLKLESPNRNSPCLSGSRAGVVGIKPKEMHHSEVDDNKTLLKVVNEIVHVHETREQIEFNEQTPLLDNPSKNGGRRSRGERGWLGNA